MEDVLSGETVVILGASDKPERYSYRALKMLQDHGHDVLLVSPRLKSIEELIVYPDMKKMKDVDTITVYVNSTISSSLKDEIIELNPKRVIFNPGSENPELMEALEKANIKVEPACTLVLLSTEQF